MSWSVRSTQCDKANALTIYAARAAGLNEDPLEFAKGLERLNQSQVRSALRRARKAKTRVDNSKPEPYPTDPTKNQFQKGFYF